MVSKPVKEEEEEMFKCTECGTLIHLGDSECPDCGMEFDEEDFETAADEEELEE
jgi:rubrerythrin